MGRFFGTDCDRDRFMDSMRREAEGFCRCTCEDDDEAWLSEVDAIILRLEKKWEPGLRVDSVKGPER